MKNKMISYRRKEIGWAYGFVAIPVLGFLLFGLLPLIASGILSFTKWDMVTSPKFVGFTNYVNLWKDEKVHKGLFNTFFMLIHIPLGMFISLLLAMLMNQKVRGVSIFRTIFYIPVISPVVAVSLLWMWMLNYDFGLVNQFLWDWFHIKGPNWLGDPHWVKPSLILMGLWGGVGGNMVLYLAGLQSISSTYYEAAEVDGANAFQKFTRITVPLLSNIHFFVVVMGVIGTFQAFSQVYVMVPDGGPEYSAATVVFNIFQHAFEYFDMGYASAEAWMLGVIILILTMIQFRLSKRWAYND
ncbi:sugar ABC transporter permease [Paenibacillus aurantius]|uniref:Sugar ABC transporter permease n=2 Tax=Paenibacillus aurantius TaxID=2918900 RepID=A0AA96LD68_9BACL|nr:sugar ABC transporter permease [Paenibacillus aurantius]WNQ10999.1 sugar ABC transporter permease [Paenibacillus aurantius]